MTVVDSAAGRVMLTTGHVMRRRNSMNDSRVSSATPSAREPRTHQARRNALGLVLGSAAGLVVDCLVILGLGPAAGFLLKRVVHTGL